MNNTRTLLDKCDNIRESNLQSHFKSDAEMWKKVCPPGQFIQYLELPEA